MVFKKPGMHARAIHPYGCVVVEELGGSDTTKQPIDGASTRFLLTTHTLKFVVVMILRGIGAVEW